MTPCTVLFDENFTFHDGAIGRKIFIVLNDGGIGRYLAVKTTSRGDRYGIQYGCQILERFPSFFLVQGSCVLSENTWVQLDAFYEFDAAKLVKRVMAGQILRIGLLEREQSLELLSCASHSEDLSEFQEGIVRQTLANLKGKTTYGASS